MDAVKLDYFDFSRGYFPACFGELASNGKPVCWFYIPLVVIGAKEMFFRSLKEASKCHKIIVPP